MPSQTWPSSRPITIVLAVLLIAQLALLSLLVIQRGGARTPEYAVPCLDAPVLQPELLLRRDADECPASPVNAGVTT